MSLDDVTDSRGHTPGLEASRRADLPVRWSVVPEVSSHLHTTREETRKLSDRYLSYLLCVLLGYAIMGKGFAYLGIPPLYIGEISLAAGLLVLSTNGSLYYLFRVPLLRVLAIFMLWGGICTVPYLSVHGADALRDAVVWGYGLFAFIVAGLVVEKPTRLRYLVLQYRRFALLFLSIMWLVLVLFTFARDALPLIPGTRVHVVQARGAEVMVHIAGITAFLITGMGRVRLPYVLLLMSYFLFLSLSSRGGMLAFLLSMTLVFLLRRRQMEISRFMPGVAVGLSLILFVALIGGGDSSITVRKYREVSFQQLWSNAVSLVSSTENEGLEGTKEWRLQWWQTIIDYTVRGDHFWTGKGYGINLANDDGFQVRRDNELRSPHNGHLTVLARSGVPGLVLWIILQLTWVIYMLRCYFSSKRGAYHAWSGIFLFVVAYWTAYIVIIGIGVYLEGPTAGIWFWAIFGLGIAAAQVYKERPEVLSDYRSQEQVETRVAI
jgi:hypothetical protein